MADLIGRADKVDQDLGRLQVEGRGEASSALDISSAVSSSSALSSAEAAELQQTGKKMEIFEGILAVLGRELEKYSDEVIRTYARYFCYKSWILFVF